MALGVAREEAVARRAEALPDCLRSAPFDRPDGFPFGLKALDFGRGRLPLRRFGERLDTGRQRFLLREVLGPHLLAIGKIFVPSGEEAVAGGAKALPDRF